MLVRSGKSYFTVVVLNLYEYLSMVKGSNGEQAVIFLVLKSGSWSCEALGNLWLSQRAQPTTCSHP